jgi:hypothetical protein
LELEISISMTNGEGDVLDVFLDILEGILELEERPDTPTAKAPTAGAPTAKAPARDRRAELVERLAKHPITAIVCVAPGAVLRVAGTVSHLDPLTIDDGNGLAVLDLDEHAERWLFRGRFELGQHLTALGTVRREPEAEASGGPFEASGGPFRDQPRARVRLVGTARHALVITDELDLVTRARHRA